MNSNSKKQAAGNDSFLAVESTMSGSSLSLYEFYNSLFEGVLADTDELKRECYRIRYQVYCIEHSGYENPEIFPDRMERDEYDAHSVHALLRHRESGKFVGTVRMILQSPTATEGKAPIYTLCSENNLTLPIFYSLENTAEISRFCIQKDFRRRIMDTLAGSSYTKEELANDAARIIPSMSLGLISMVVLMSQKNDLRQWYAGMEPFLLRLLSKLGIYFDPVGPLIDFHGKRQLCQRPVAALLSQVQKERPDVWEIITKKGEYCITE